jgi:LacI family transcriptional regulator
VAEEMGYITDSIAGSLRSGSTRTVAVILGDISNPHFAIMVKEIEAALSAFRYHTFVINTNEDYETEKQAVYSALGKKVDGIILCPSQKGLDDIEFLKKSGTPFVLIGRHINDTSVDYAIVDDIKGGYLATAHLIDRGHSRILFLNGPLYISSAAERFEGYKKALREHGIAFSKKLVREITVTQGEVHHEVKKIMGQGVRFTAIFAFSDLIAWETIYALNTMGIRVPEDIGVAGFDDIQAKLFFPIPLTSIGTVKGRMSTSAVEILMKKIEGKNAKNYFNSVIDTCLVVRKTT